MPIKKIETFLLERTLQSNVVPQALLTSELLIAPSLYAERTFVWNLTGYSCMSANRGVTGGVTVSLVLN